MKIIAFFILCILLSGCKSNTIYKSKNIDYVRKYFSENKWNFPYNIDTLTKIKSTFNDSNKWRKYDYILLTKMFYNAYNTILKIDSNSGYYVGYPQMYKDSNNIYISAYIGEYMNNYKNEMMPCQDCEEIDSNRIWLMANRIVYKIISKDSIIFCRWDD